MAKPIGATPILKGKDAEEFINSLISPTYSEKQKRLFKEMKELETITKSQD